MSNTKNYSGSKKGVARFVVDQLQDLKPDYVLITIISRDLSGEPYAATVTGASSAAIEHLMGKSYSKVQHDTSPDRTLAM